MKIIILSLIIVIFFSLSAQAETNISAEASIRNIFPNFQDYKTENLAIDNQVFKIFTVLQDNQIIGWAVMLDEMGKINPITFLVGMDIRAKVLGVYVLEYQDIFGAEVKRRSFLRQFIGKSLNDTLQVGRDIDAVTGATISSQAATMAVKKSLKLIEELQNN